jgi:predicted alpha-1,2-mannosidase
MKQIFLFLAFFFLKTTLINSQTDFLPFVNPFIGTDAHGHTYPGAVAPFGMVQLSPDTRLDGWDGASGYHYSDSLIYGFSHTHLSGTGVSDYCDVLFMPFTGKVELENKNYASSFKKSKEHAEAGYYSVFLEKDKIKAELTATERVGIHRYTFPKNRENGHLLIDLRHRDEVLSSQMTLVNNREIEGSRVSKSWAKEQHIYFVVRFSKAFNSSKILDMSLQPKEANPSVASKSIVGVFDFKPEGEPLIVTVGISFVSIEGARKNLEKEANSFDFDEIKEQTQEKWRNQLQKIEVTGGTKEQKTAFFTALYHTMIVPNIFNDVDGKYRGRDLKIHENPKHDVYSVFSLWDTYRACNPLYTLIEPRRTNDFIQTFLKQYKQGGLLPIWELGANETDCMIGNHAIPVIADAYLKGINDFDAEIALQAMIKSSNQDRLGLNFYKSLGFLPAEKESESVSKTLEYAFDDWCIAKMAEKMGKTDIANTYYVRAQNYKNLFDPSSGFFRAKNNSTWYVPFDPFEVNFNYTEANAWQYRFAAPQDIKGMMQLLGGAKAMETQLDLIFSAKTATTGRNQSDITGLIGQYVHGNEPSHHIAYLYNYVAQPHKTQQKVRQIMDEMYSEKPDGLSGNEDCGQMSAWLVWSALGMYPVAPANEGYAIGTPMFEKVVLHLENKQDLIITAPKVSSSNFYIKSAKLNGNDLQKSIISHETLLKGGKLDFEMSATPTSLWNKTENAPETSIPQSDFVAVPFIEKSEKVFLKSQIIALGNIDKEANIFYTLDGSIPSINSTKYIKPFVLKKSSTLNAISVKGNTQSKVISADFLKSKTEIANVSYETQYNQMYDGRGERGLVDQLEGGTDFRNGDWQGFEGKNLDIVLDFGKKKAFKKVSVGFLQDHNAWIFLPLRIEIEVSDNGKDFKQIGSSKDLLINSNEEGTLVKNFEAILEKSQKARFVRVKGISLVDCPKWHKGVGYACWIMADEIKIE